MMKIFEFKPTGICSTKIIFNIEDDKVLDVKVIGGCPGNGLGIRSLLKDQNIDYIIEKLNGIKCGFKPTSCPDQIAQGLKAYKQKRDLK